jgi:hypothetical protein
MPGQIRRLGYFKSLGVNLICDVSFGTNISSWGYVTYFKKNKPKYNMFGYSKRMGKITKKQIITFIERKEFL